MDRQCAPRPGQTSSVQLVSLVVLLCHHNQNQSTIFHFNKAIHGNHNLISSHTCILCPGDCPRTSKPPTYNHRIGFQVSTAVLVMLQLLLISIHFVVF